MKRTTAWLTTAAALTGLAACTSSGPSDRPEKEQPRASAPASLTALRAAEQATERARSVRVRSTTVMGSQLSLTADGVLAWRDGLSGSLTIHYTGGTAAETMRGLGVTSMQARYLADAYYARMGDTFAARTGGKHWLRYAYDDLKALGGGADLADQMRSTTPDQSVRLLLDSDDVRELGRETVDGQGTTHYTGTVDVRDVTDTELRRRLQAADVTAETVDIWINEKNLLVKKVEKTSTANGKVTQTAHYSDYGVKVAVRKPPAADTEDFKNLLSQSGTNPT
ncbi:LppX_LprAFG lipoprotein [Streptomyces sp. NRRL B-24085]|uniref:LppX_LprAFG lipoprotein n=1 Tax=Streptomyces sp. NRRL B-24085 TaxID=1709476 RepID=UPI0006B364E7|nr:LppX_LprAFG lipoprotein [Streptomyces sp. NRRL B-24085]